MNVGWIAPLDKKCGIAFYARKYADALSRIVRIVECDPQDFITNKKRFLDKLSGCDCIHIQYETSFFLHGKRDFFPDLCERLPMKKVVTLHELYRTIPGVFPREAIGGSGPLRALRELAWDKRHRHWALFARHLKNGFFADAIIVHAEFQREICVEKGLDNRKIKVIPLPIKPSLQADEQVPRSEAAMVLGATGFINPSYDYELLFSVLERLAGEWRFVWVGGPRRDEDAALLRRIEDEIGRREWRGRFTVTGWVADEERDRLLHDMDIFCAFFKERSSSESLADAIGARAPIIACRMTMTEEISSRFGVLFLAPHNARDIAESVSAMYSDKNLRHDMKEAQAKYAQNYSYEACGTMVVTLYEQVLAS